MASRVRFLVFLPTRRITRFKSLRPFSLICRQVLYLNLDESATRNLGKRLFAIEARERNDGRENPVFQISDLQC